MRGNHPLLGLVLGLFAVTLFGASPPATRAAVEALDPYFVTAARGAAAGLLALGVLAVLRRPVPWRDLPVLVLISLCLVVGFPGMMALALTTLTSAHGGVILGLLPIATAIAAVFVAGERPSLFFWAMSLLGAVLVVAFSLPHGGIVPSPADLLLIVAVAICGTGYALAGNLSRRMPGWEVISWAVVLSLPVLLPLTLILWPQEAASAPWPSWAGLAYVALVSQYLGFWLWNSALAIGGVARIGQLQLLQTFATLAIAAVLLGEAVTLRMLFFATAVVVVVALGVRARVGSRGAPGAAIAPVATGTGGS
jgi:drug/metabolite transporter (DMT)-like permease